jgi:hypothetical protein
MVEGRGALWAGVAVAESASRRAVSPGRPLSAPLRFLVYGLLGWCVELLFTCLYDLALGQNTLRLQGYTYLWMHPVWGVGVLACERVLHALRAWRVPYALRGLCFALFAFTVEYTSGALLTVLLGRPPWDYSHARFNVQGLIRLDYAPFWALCGWLGEPICLWVQRLRLAPRASGPTPTSATDRRVMVTLNRSTTLGAKYLGLRREGEVPT